uniref:Chorismate synthase n=2 Tax=Candidatus Methanophagaceae archaeon ANME-1 ERB6 TaxID=2759912 RepID=A0A7G9YXC0_9EURY|nr:chorismate synthase [Methanosarcinales archaeon ANME-1 ERB6]
MSGNTFGKIFRVTTWGESHGAAMGVVVDSCPAELELSEGDVQHELDRRKPGVSELTTERKEADEVKILSGVFDGKTLGTPISMLVWNKDVDSSPYERIKNIARPGQADFTYQMKYGIRDYRGGGRASGRETAARVAAGAIARKILVMHDIQILGHVVEIGGIVAKEVEIEELRKNVDKNAVRCADSEAAGKMEALIKQVKAAGDSVGGIVEVIAFGVPTGLGEPVFDKLDAELAKALMSIGAVKGVEIGAGFAAARMKGSEMNDEFIIKEGRIRTKTNNAGGILGGISTGAPVVCRIAVKPTASISKPQRSVDMAKMEEVELKIEGRHDPCICPRIVPVAEAMVALVLVDCWMRNESIK